MFALLPYFVPLAFVAGFAVGRSPVILRRPPGGSTAQAPASVSGNRATADGALTSMGCLTGGQRQAGTATRAMLHGSSRTTAPTASTAATAGRRGAAKQPRDAGYCDCGAHVKGTPCLFPRGTA